MRQRERRVIEDVMVGMGLSEAMTVPLIAGADLERVGRTTDGAVEATNALRADEPILRPAILPGLLKSVAFNTNQGLLDLALFELGHVFGAPQRGDVLPDERDHLAVLLAGTSTRTPIEADRPVDVYDAVDVLDALVEALELSGVRLVAGPEAGFDPARSAAITVDGATIGHVGAIPGSVLEAFGISVAAVGIEA
jgi:phenylalanyl-tRNA synthetase beta chain